MFEAMHVNMLILFNLTALTIAAILAYVGIPLEVFTLLALLMTLDVFFGVCKAFKMHNEVSSRRLISGVLGKVAGLFVVISLALIAKVATILIGAELSSVHLLNTLLIFVAIGEGHSIIRNFIACHKKIEVPEWSVWIFLARGIVAVAEKLISKIK